MHDAQRSAPQAGQGHGAQRQITVQASVAPIVAQVRATLKRAIVWGASRDLIPASIATQLIALGGLAHD